MKKSKTIEGIVTDTQAEGLHVLYAQLRQGGQMIEEYRRTPHKARLNVYSISKCVVSAGIGIAMDEGLLSLDEPICEAFSEYVPPSASSNLLDLRVRDLLTMTTGLAEPLFFGDDPERYTVKNWIAHFFNAEFTYKPGERFLYSNFNTYILSCMVERRAKQNLLEYLRFRLFEPLGIGNPDWTLCPAGHVHAANGLYLTIDELGNFGEMLLHYGEYKGKQLVPETYLRNATVKQTDNVLPSQVGEHYQTYGYGYHFWMTPIPDTFICNGNYGQFCLVMPKKDTVISVMSFEGNNYKRIRDILVDYAIQL